MSGIHTFQTAIIRSPLLSYSQSVHSVFDELVLQKIADNPVLIEALYLSSPSLYNELLQQSSLIAVERDKLHAALVRYGIRAATRPTPYGIFAGCNPAALGDSTLIELSATLHYKKNIQLDMHFLGAIEHEAIKIPAIRNYLLFSPNNSIYRLGSQFRYVQYSRKDDRKKYHIAAVGYDESFSRIFDLSKNGITLNDLANTLAAQSGQTTEELMRYLDSLVEAQLLVSELEPLITGADPLDSLRKTRVT